MLIAARGDSNTNHTHETRRRPPYGTPTPRLQVKKFEAKGQLKLMLGCCAKRLVTEPDTGRVAGVSYVDTSTNQEGFVAAHDTVLATGGFANDRTNTSLLSKHRPDLVRRHS